MGWSRAKSLRRAARPGSACACARSVAVLVVLLGALVWPGPASAQGEDRCPISVTPSTTEHGAIVVQKGETVMVSAQADGSPRPVDLYYLGMRWRLTETSGGAATLKVDDFALWGVGLYKVAWGTDCSRSFRVVGPFFRAVAADVATATLVISLIVLLLTLTLRVRIANPDARWVLKLVAKGKLERGEETGELRAKSSYTVAQTLLGTLWGLLLGGASFATLQQAALTPPTIEVALEVTLPLTAIGVLAGLRRGRPRPIRPRSAATPVSPA